MNWPLNFENLRVKRVFFVVSFPRLEFSQSEYSAKFQK